MNLNINIKPEDVFSQKEMESVKKTEIVFNEKNYLQARLKPNETTKTLVIRLLPFTLEGGSPFHKVYMHQVRVNKEVSPSGWKMFPCPIKNGLKKECPFCELAKEAKIEKSKSIIEQERKKFNDLEFANTAREMWLARCIERGHEEDGVKFWMFPHSKKGNGVYDKIFNIFQTRFNNAAKQNKYNNIFDVNDGKDLIITLTKDSNNYTVINITDDEDKSPLSDDYEKASSWISDTKKWTDIFTLKPYDYMSIIAQGGIPFYNKEKKCYVDKFDMEKEVDDEIEKNITKPNIDYSITENNKSSFINNDLDDDLPF